MRHRRHSGPALGRVKVEFVLAESVIVDSEAQRVLEAET